MKVLVCSPYAPEALRGNSVAAGRLSAGFTSRGHPTRTLTAPDASDPDTVRSVVADFQPDVFLVLHAWRCAPAFRAVREASTAPVVVALRGTDANEMLEDPTTGPTVLSVLDGCDAITVFHEAMRAQLRERRPGLAEKTSIVPNGLDVPSSSVDYRARLDVPSDAFVFVNVAGLRAVKRPLAAAEAVAGVRARHGQVHLLHAGPDMESDEAARYHAFVRGHSWVHHFDAVPHAEIDSFLRAGDVYISASRSEGMPHAVREGMAVGLASLLSDIVGHRQMAEADKEALFFRDHGEAQHGADRLIVDAAFRAGLGRAARARIARECSGCDEIGAYIALFQQLTAEERREHATRHGSISERGPNALLADHATRFVLDHLRVEAGSVVAEPGCGTAVMSIFAARAGAARVIGTDIDSASVRTARRNVQLNRLHTVEIREGSLLDAVDEPLDLVVALLPHKPGPRAFSPRYYGGPDGTRWLLAVIEQSAQRLRKGGRLVLYLNSIANPVRVLTAFRRSFKVRLLGEKKRYFSREEFESLAPGMVEHLCTQRDQGAAEFHEDGEGMYFWARLYEGVRLQEAPDNKVDLSVRERTPS